MRSFLIILGVALIGLLILVVAGNMAVGCYPWSPKEVEYRQGMTLCPGQTAVFKRVYDDKPHLRSDR